MKHIINGFLTNTQIHLSPHYDVRPDGEVSLLVIHNISLPAGVFGTKYIHELFHGKLDSNSDPSFKDLDKLKVAAHLVISRDGFTTQYVSFLNRAWHAGKSWFEGRDNCNNFSIGIELEGTDLIPYTKEQYCALIEISKIIMINYPQITIDRIVGHCDIAPGRKTDPGASFDWEFYKNLL